MKKVLVISGHTDLATSVANKKRFLIQSGNTFPKPKL